MKPRGHTWAVIQLTTASQWTAREAAPGGNISPGTAVRSRGLLLTCIPVSQVWVSSWASAAVLAAEVAAKMSGTVTGTTAPPTVKVMKGAAIA